MQSLSQIFTSHSHGHRYTTADQVGQGPRGMLGCEVTVLVKGFCSSTHFDNFLRLPSSQVKGIIYPPPDIRAIVDKTARFVAKNGKSFEERIQASEEGKSAKFNFMRPHDPYYAYYEFKIRDFEENGDAPAAVSTFFFFLFHFAKKLTMNTVIDTRLQLQLTRVPLGCFRPLSYDLDAVQYCISSPQSRGSVLTAPRPGLLQFSHRTPHIISFMQERPTSSPFAR